ncbi:MAG: YIP1 family protein [Candidatus Heimdallarchaeaceae archaeon]|jgi:hypothetical protein
MNKHSLKENIEEDFYETTPLYRLVDHHLLRSDSFVGLSKEYMIIVPTIALLILLALKLGNFSLLINRISFGPGLEEELPKFKESIYFGLLITSIPQVILWASLIHPLLKFLGGQGKYSNSLVVYSIAQIPIVVGMLLLFVFALIQPSTSVYSLTTLTEPTITTITLEPNFFLLVSFNSVTRMYRIAETVILPITSLYSHLIAGVGFSAVHKIPKALGIIIGVVAYITSMLFYFII